VSCSKRRLGNINLYNEICKSEGGSIINNDEHEILNCIMIMDLSKISDFC